MPAMAVGTSAIAAQAEILRMSSFWRTAIAVLRQADPREVGLQHVGQQAVEPVDRVGSPEQVVLHELGQRCSSGVGGVASGAPVSSGP